MSYEVELPPRRVEEEKLIEFAAATATQNPIYLSAAESVALGHRALIATPTFAAVWLGQILDQILSSDLDVNYDRVVHGEQHFSYRRPIFAGDVLKPKLRVVRDRTLGDARQIVLEVALISETPMNNSASQNAADTSVALKADSNPGSNTCEEVLVMTITLIVRGGS